MTIFGKEAGQPFDEIRKILYSIFFAASKLGQRYWKDQGRTNFSEIEFQRRLKEMQENENIICASFDANDKISNQVDKCITKIESYCEASLKKKMCRTVVFAIAGRHNRTSTSVTQFSLSSHRDIIR